MLAPLLMAPAIRPVLHDRRDATLRRVSALMAVNWSLSPQPINPLQALQAFGMAQQQKQAQAQAEQERVQREREFALRERQVISGEAAAGVKTRNENRDLGLKLYSNVKDEASYARARQAAAVRGIDLGLPEQYDPNAVGALQQEYAALNPAKETADPSVIRALREIGIDPASPEGRQIVIQNLNPPQYQAFGDSLYQTRGPGMGGSPAPKADIRGFVGSVGGGVTSGFRSPADNKRVGGVTNSMHMTGDALDTVPPQGVSMDQWAGQLRQQFPGYEVLNEGDHVHVEAKGSGIGGSGPRVVATKSPSEGKAAKGPSATRVAGGKTYYKVNGRWFDNADGN